MDGLNFKVPLLCLSQTICLTFKICLRYFYLIHNFSVRELALRNIIEVLKYYYKAEYTSS